jgi:hypothetical protein
MITDRHPRKAGTPIYVFDEHHEAFFWWETARAEGLIATPLDLFHVDAHEDMDRPRHFRQSVYFRGRPEKGSLAEYYRKFVSEELHISNFIIPAVLDGIVKNVYFIYPPWKKLRPGRTSMSVCSVFGEGQHLKYDARVKQGSQGDFDRVFPDSKVFRLFRRDITGIPSRRKVILDIDLDYFACRDSILNHMSYTLEVSREQFVNRGIVLNDPTLPYSRLEMDFSETGGRYLARISFKKTPEVSHLPSKEEIRGDIEAFAKSLTHKGVRPAVVTISRSCHSGYCPEEYAEFVERELIDALRELPAVRAGSR